jgi:DNA repair protein RadD
VVEKSQHRNCVMIFCSTIQHAEEAMESLPPEISYIVTGKTSKKERENIIASAKKGKIKYLV